MILLCSSNQSVLNRWKSFLGVEKELHYAFSMEKLWVKLKISTPDVLLIHLALADLDGGKGIDVLRQRYPDIKLMLFADRPDEREGVIYLKKGVFSYCNTYMSPSMLAMVLEVVKSGEVWVGEKLTQFLIKNINGVDVRDDQAVCQEKLSMLTDREHEIALLIGEGESNQRIAYKLEIAERTVKAHLGIIFRKTNTNDRLQLALYVKGYRK